jgi:hypothetical protein
MTDVIAQRDRDLDGRWTPTETDSPVTSRWTDAMAS